VTSTPGTPTPADLIAHYGLEPIPREGGLFQRTWAGAERADGRPEGTAIVALLTAAPGDFSALHRLPSDEIWHFYLGDPLELLLLAPDGASRTVLLGPALLHGQPRARRHHAHGSQRGRTWQRLRLP
jgi:predicted cupin superfamily sugar epimerase